VCICDKWRRGWYTVFPFQHFCWGFSTVEKRQGGFVLQISHFRVLFFHTCYSSSSSSRACPSWSVGEAFPLSASTVHDPEPVAKLTPRRCWAAASPVQLYEVKFVVVAREVVSIAWQSRNNGSKSTCMIHSAVGPRDMTKKRRRLSRRVVDSCVWPVRRSTSAFVTRRKY